MDLPGSPVPPPSPEPPSRGSSTWRLGLAVAMVLAGLIWIGQGLGILTAGGSFMIGDRTWAVIGAVFVILGLVLAIRERSRRR